MIIRNARIEDIEDLSKVALSTAMAGEDGDKDFFNKDLISQYYCEPYIRYNSEYCFVVEENGIACGYIVGTDDSNKFFKWFNESWLVKIREQYVNGKAISEEEERILKMIKEDVEPSTFFKEYPAHLHINISKSLQGQSVGKQLIESLLQKLTSEGVKAIHLGVARKNDKAIGFYKHLGFKMIEDQPWGYYMGKKLTT